MVIGLLLLFYDINLREARTDLGADYDVADQMRHQHDCNDDQGVAPEAQGRRLGRSASHHLLQLLETLGAPAQDRVRSKSMA